MIFSATLSSLFASDTYIKVMSIKNKDSLFNTSYSLKEYGYKMYITEHKSWYRVYTGPFKDSTSAQKALQVIKKNISKGAFLVNLEVDSKNKKLKSTKKEEIKNPLNVAPVAVVPLITKEKSKVEKQNLVKIKVEIYSPVEIASQSNEKISADEKSKDEKQCQDNPYKNTRFFIAASAGLSKFDVKENDINGVVVLDNNPKDAGSTYGLELGYYFNNYIFVTANYQHTILQNVNFDNAFGTLNYKLDYFDSISPYVGVLAGYNIMNWDNYPISSAIVHKSSSSFFGGAQIGNDIELSEHFAIYIFYRYMMINNTTRITVGALSKEIEHDNEQNINIGFKVSF